MELAPWASFHPGGGAGGKRNQRSARKGHRIGYPVALVVAAEETRRQPAAVWRTLNGEKEEKWMIWTGKEKMYTLEG